MTYRRPFALASLLLSLGLVPAVAEAQPRADRVSMELSLDHGAGWNAADGLGVEVAADLRLRTPIGLGAVLRAGFSNLSIMADLGVSGTLPLLPPGRIGVELGLAAGPSVAVLFGPFGSGGDRPGVGGWVMAHVDLRIHDGFVGLGITARALASLDDHGNGRDERNAPSLSVIPMLRVGGAFGL